MVNFTKFFLTFILAFAYMAAAAQNQGVIRGKVQDAATGQPVVGAAVILQGTVKGTATDENGEFLILEVPTGPCQVDISFLGYKNFVSETLNIKAGQSYALDVKLVENVSEMENVVVVATRKVSTDAGLIAQMRSSSLVVSGVSGQSIARTQDRDASEVIKRIPGISVIDDKFVIVRGLAQRYNNVWINGAAVPSSEADTRSFSFDIIPSSQIENLTIVKSPAPEIPADFAGGFIRIHTKVVPESNSFQITYGTGFNSVTHNNDFRLNKGGGTDFLGFDNGTRALKNLPQRIDNDNTAAVDAATKTGFNNNWKVLTRSPLIDQKLTLAGNRRFEAKNDDRYGLVAALNYSNTNKSLLHMQNNQFGIYDYRTDQSVYRVKYIDDQYVNDVKLGAMLNLSYAPASKGETVSRYEFRNIFNQLGRNRFTSREGTNVRGGYEEQQDEYLYSSRTAYTGQFAGDHTWKDSRVDWNAAYSYSNRNQPDRRIVGRLKDPMDGITEYSIDQSTVSRYFTRLDEHLVSGGANFSHKFTKNSGFQPELKAGLYGEYKTRKYDTRNFLYKWNANNNTLPDGFRALPAEELFGDGSPYLGTDGKIHIQEQTQNTDNYSADNVLAAAYAAVNLPLGRFNIYTGVRFEQSTTTLTSYISDVNFKTARERYTYTNPLPSVNATYSLNPQSLLRLAYGMSVNRPEFRELAPSTYYDFDMFSFITGNPELKQATIQNIDLRYELYPSNGELVSVSLFYKRFRNPIEWNYVDAGGSYQFSFENAESADNYGVEVDIRKDLGFIGLQNFMTTINASWIKSNVHFGKNSLEHDRPMQGQSPYLINAGLFYQNEKIGLSVGALYNRIGKRIIGVGRLSTSSGDNFNNNIPDMYELPRNAVDLTFSKRIYKGLEIKGGIKDILAEPVEFRQFPQFKDADGVVHNRSQVTKKYYPGRQFSLSLSATF